MRTLRLFHALPLLAAVALLPRPAAAQDDDANWVAHCPPWNNGNDREQFCEERVAHIAAPRLLSVDGRENGGVEVRAWDGSGVEVRERIQAWGATQEEARALAGQVRVNTDGGTIRADGPQAGGRPRYVVSYLVLVPRRTDLRVETHNGPLAVSGVTGRIELSTTNGPLALRDLGGQVHARAENGPLSVRLAGTRWSGEGLDAATTNGPVTLSVPGGYAATLTTGSVNGPMNGDVPVTVNGRFPRQFTTELSGGGAPIRVVTTNGPVVVRRL